MADRTTHSLDGTPIAIHDLGGIGPTALLVHGAGLHGRVFIPLAIELRASLHCYALDLRGHGESAHETGLDFSWSRLSEDVSAAAGELGEVAVAIGHSAGATAALRAEALEPGTFSAMYCYEPVMRTPEMVREITVEHPLVAQTLRRKAEFASREEALERYQDRPPLDTLDPRALRAYVEYGFADRPDGSVELICKPEYEAAIYLAGIESDLPELAALIACPVTIAIGRTATNTLGPMLAEVALTRIADSQRVEFPGLGHFGPLEDPRAVAHSISKATETTRA